MNRNDDFTQMLESWLHRQAPLQAPDRVLDSALERVTNEPQRLSWLQRLFGGTTMTLMIRTATVAAVVAVAAVIGLQVNTLINNAGNTPPEEPSPSPSPAQAVDFPAMATTFVSPTNGFSFNYQDRGGLAPATQLWDPVNQPPIDEAVLDGFGAPHWAGFDVVETGLGAVFQGASTEIPDGVSIDEWVDAAVVKYLPAGCRVPRSQQAPITIDGQSGRISENCPNKVVATVVAGGRLYLFMLSHSRRDARALFDVWVATIDLTPGTAAVP